MILTVRKFIEARKLSFKVLKFKPLQILIGYNKNTFSKNVKFVHTFLKNSFDNFCLEKLNLLVISYRSMYGISVFDIYSKKCYLQAAFDSLNSRQKSQHSHHSQQYLSVVTLILRNFFKCPYSLCEQYRSEFGSFSFSHESIQ